jgi:hypothetical protein
MARGVFCPVAIPTDHGSGQTPKGRGGHFATFGIATPPRLAGKEHRRRRGDSR